MDSTVPCLMCVVYETLIYWQVFVPHALFFRGSWRSKFAFRVFAPGGFLCFYFYFCVPFFALLCAQLFCSAFFLLPCLSCHMLFNLIACLQNVLIIFTLQVLIWIMSVKKRCLWNLQLSSYSANSTTIKPQQTYEYQSMRRNSQIWYRRAMLRLIVCCTLLC